MKNNFTYKDKAVLFFALDLILAPIVGIGAYYTFRQKNSVEQKVEQTPAIKAYDAIMPKDVYKDPVEEFEGLDEPLTNKYKIESFPYQDEKTLFARAALRDGETCSLDEMYPIGFVAYSGSNVYHRAGMVPPEFFSRMEK